MGGVIANRLQVESAGICTLFEGDYHLGLAAFLNSLLRAGFAGTVWAGYRGALPPWLGQLKRANADADEYWIVDQIRIVFMKLNTGIHLTNYKPEFMLNLLANEARDCKYLWYFDPDIFVKASWSFFADWQSYGIALCQEVVDNIFPADAPLRSSGSSWPLVSVCGPAPINHYYNGGMVGVPSAHAEFLEKWKGLISLAGSMGCDLKHMAHGSREMPFNIIDQDALNIAIMYTKSPLSTLGPQGMGFIFGASMMMFHTVGEAMEGIVFAASTERHAAYRSNEVFLHGGRYADSCHSPVHLRTKRMACSIAALIGRFYRKS